MHRVPKPWLTAAFAALAAVCAPAALSADCNVYQIEGVRLGMTPKDVKKAMRGEAEKSEREEAGESATVRATFLRSPSQLEVTYDAGAAGRSREMAAVSLRYSLSTASALEFLALLGPPDAGDEHLGDGLVRGPVVWLEEACGIVVTADRKAAAWWQGGADSTTIEIETWTRAREREGSPAAVAIAAWEMSPAESWEAVVSLQPSEAAAPAGVAPALPSEIPPAATVESRGVYEAPVRLEESYVSPRYPRFPAGARVPGRVVLEVTIEEDGSVGDIAVRSVTPIARGFEGAAQEAVRKWKYRPGTLDGVPVQAKVTVEMEFR
jgi:TonB family protein